MNDFVKAGLLTKTRLAFSEIHQIASRLPLYGKTRAVNLTRALSGAREAVGLPGLEYSEVDHAAVVNMHANVSNALLLLGIQSFEDAQDACEALSGP